MANPWELNEGSSLRPWAVGIVCVSLAVIGVEIFRGGEEKAPATVQAPSAAAVEVGIGAPAESLVLVRGDGEEAFVQRNWSDLSDRRESSRASEFLTLSDKLHEQQLAATLQDLKGLFVAEAAPDANQQAEAPEKNPEADGKAPAGRESAGQPESKVSGDKK